MCTRETGSARNIVVDVENHRALQAENERLRQEARSSTRWATAKWVDEAKRLEEERDAAIERGRWACRYLGWTAEVAWSRLDELQESESKVADLVAALEGRGGFHAPEVCPDRKRPVRRNLQGTGRFCMYCEPALSHAKGVGE